MIWYIYSLHHRGWESEKESIASRRFNDPDSFLLHVFSKQNHLQFLFPTSYLAQSFPSCLPLLELKDLVKSQNTQLPCYMDPQCPSSDIAWGNHPPGRKGDPSHWDEILTSPWRVAFVVDEKMLRCPPQNWWKYRNIYVYISRRVHMSANKELNN